MTLCRAREDDGCWQLFLIYLEVHRDRIAHLNMGTKSTPPPMPAELASADTQTTCRRGQGWLGRQQGSGRRACMSMHVTHQHEGSSL